MTSAITGAVVSVVVLSVVVSLSVVEVVVVSLSVVEVVDVPSSLLQEMMMRLKRKIKIICRILIIITPPTSNGSKKDRIVTYSTILQ